MNQEETIALWQRCEVARAEARAKALSEGKSEPEARAVAHDAATAVWNGWAEDMLAKRTALEAAGLWAVNHSIFDDFEPMNDETRHWMSAALSDFTAVQFVSQGYLTKSHTVPAPRGWTADEPIRPIVVEDIRIAFSDFVFPAAARFKEVRFYGVVGFEAAQFTAPASFESAQFYGDAGFRQAHFARDANFARAQFLGDAYFDRTKFLCRAGFGGARFCQYAEFREAEFKSEARFVKAQFDRNAVFQAAQFLGDTRFDATQFAEGASFQKAQLSGHIAFEATQFRGDAWFEETEFAGHPRFERASFSGNARFDGTQFKEQADFRAAQFKKDAWFSATKFESGCLFEDAWFENAARFDDACFASCSDARVSFLMARFAGYTSFEAAIFGGDIRFDAIRGESVFDLAGASFDALPSFIQANFKEPPRFDHLTLKTPLASSERRESLARALGICARQCWERRGGLSAEEKAEARDTTSKFRALKALAIKAHDGEREHLFFKGEMRARRISEDEGWAVRAGNVAYDLFSDFGRSFLRPFVVWLVLLFGFAGAYWAGSFPAAPRTGCDRLSAARILALPRRQKRARAARQREGRAFDRRLSLPVRTADHPGEPAAQSAACAGRSAADPNSRYPGMGHRRRDGAHASAASF